MRAVVQGGYGGPEVLRVVLDRPQPAPGKGEVLVRVRAAGVDKGTWHLMTGTPLLVRPAIGFARPRQPVPGLDLAGVVAGVGEGVSGFAVGDEVFGLGRGSLAEFCVAKAGKLAPKHPGLSWGEAAALGVSGLTALQAVDAGRVTAGSKVLVSGASGGVGSFAVQIAHARGANVTAVCHPDRAAHVSKLGADRVLDRTSWSFPSDGSFDAIVDIAGNPTLRQLRRALAPGGTAVVVGGEQRGSRLLGGFGRSLVAPLAGFGGKRVLGLIAKEQSSDLVRLAALVADGSLQIPLAATYPLSDTASALRHLASGTVTGKLAVLISR